MEQKIVMVDVDSTLWDFGLELSKRMSAKFPEKEIPLEFDTWNAPLDFFDCQNDAYDLFVDIHKTQHTYGTFKHANFLVRNLRRAGYYILIASNRKPVTKPFLMEWLEINDIVYDEVYCDVDKRELFDTHDISLVIDDSPYIQESTMNLDIPVLTLRYKYNKSIRGTKKFDNLLQMNEYVINSIMVSPS